MTLVRGKRWATAALLAVAGCGLFSGGQVAVAAPPTVIATAPATEPAPELTTQDVNTWLDGLVPAQLNINETPGAIVSVVKDGQVITTRGYGYADVETKTPVTEDTLFRVGSVSKIPTTITALHLVEQGKLDLDVDISTYVDVPIDRSFEEPITLRNLLTHTSGFEERLGFNTERFEEGATYDLAQDVLTDPPKQVFRPGSTPAYSNYGMLLTGYIIEQVTGKSFEQAVEDSVLRPAGMEVSTYRQPLPVDIAGQMATGYNTTGSRGEGFERISSSDGSLTASGAEMARFMNAQLDGTLLSPKLQEFAWQPGIETTYSGQTLGLGYFLGERNGHKTVGHGGDVAYFHSYMELYPEDNIGFFISMNGDGNGKSDLRSTIAHAFAERYLPGEENPPLTDPAAVQRAQQVAGRYEFSRTFESTFGSLIWDLAVVGSITATEDGGLVANGGPLMGVEIYFEQVAPWLWRDLNSSATIAADPTGENPALMYAAVNTLIPTTFFHTFTWYGLIISLVCLVLALLAWPLGAWRRMTRLTWGERIARLGAVAFFAVIGCLLIMVSDLFSISDTLIRTTQAFAFLGALANVPAAWGLVQAIRGRAGWSRVLSNTFVLIGLVLITVVLGTHHFYSLDISI